ncbi:peptidylprolyl isomerase [Actimicrobium antarcticum]|uniref:Peptidyl-prolyl cis-trans isomerase n=1 Tax=Actimicrobium antarcticum TaxID=1051899 RepID=A0ABP7U2B1_9BURK
MHSTRRQLNRLIAGLVIATSSACVFAADAPRVLLKTSMGDIVLELDAEKAPKSVDNFLSYVKSGHYKGTIFHRVIDGFMIQGGGFDKNMHQKSTSAPIRNEASNGLKNAAYTVAMARTGDPDSATAQFFINVGNNAMLDYPGRDGAGYAVFGKVVSGQDVVDKIRLVATGNAGMYQNVPQTPIVIENATLAK